MKNIELRSYQQKAISQIKIGAVNVLSICPGGGKTLTAISWALTQKDKNVLILAHGTTVLKNQWNDVMDELGIEYSNDITAKCKFVISIPQAITKKTLPKFDIIIVDEAHEFYYAENMVKSIITAVKPKTQLLLTGTPSKFIKQGLKPIIISGVEVYQEGYLADPYLACVYSAYSLDEASFDKVSNDVKASIKDTKAIVKKSFENLIEQMLERLKNANMIKGKPNLKGALTITGLHKAANYLFEKLDKTMISARSIEQAEMLHDILTKNKVDTLLSTSEDDTDSVNIEQFKNDPKIKVLVVVKRGILGFNMPELINVVDFSGTRNIDRIYQLYARTLRKYEDKPKFYFKLCYGVNQDIDSLYVQAALCLNNPSFIEKFNGKNLKAMDIIVLSKDKKKRDKDKDDKDNNVDNPKSISVDSNLAVEVLRLGLMSELTINDQHESWKEYKHVRFGKAIVKLQGLEFGLNPELKTDAELREEVFTLLAKEGIEHEKMY